MKISIYTLAKNACRLDFHLSAMLNHHLEYADEIIVCECFSTDNTYNEIKSIQNPKLKVIRKEWNPSDSYLKILDETRSYCTGDWCIKLDLDEFIPEWEWASMREFLRSTKDHIIPIRLINFYGSYLTYHSMPEKSSWPLIKWPVHRNLDNIVSWGDSSNVKFVDADAYTGRAEHVGFEVHHFGTVRHPGRLREKWRTQAKRNQKNTNMYKNRRKILSFPSFVFKFFKHNWKDPEIIDYLKVYDGKIMDIVQKNPEEFIRDNKDIYKMIIKMKNNDEKNI